MGRAGSENARMRGAVMAQRQQQHFYIGRLDAGGAADPLRASTSAAPTPASPSVLPARTRGPCAK